MHWNRFRVEINGKNNESTKTFKMKMNSIRDINYMQQKLVNLVLLLLQFECLAFDSLGEWMLSVEDSAEYWRETIGGRGDTTTFSKISGSLSERLGEGSWWELTSSRANRLAACAMDGEGATRWNREAVSARENRNLGFISGWAPGVRWSGFVTSFESNAGEWTLGCGISCRSCKRSILAVERVRFCNSISWSRSWILFSFSYNFAKCRWRKHRFLHW